MFIDAHFTSKLCFSIVTVVSSSVVCSFSVVVSVVSAVVTSVVTSVGVSVVTSFTATIPFEESSTLLVPFHNQSDTATAAAAAIPTIAGIYFFILDFLEFLFLSDPVILDMIFLVSNSLNSSKLPFSSCSSASLALPDT